MGEDWEKLAGEEGEEVPTGRFKRIFKLGKMGTKVGAATVGSTLMGMFRRDPDDKKKYLDDAYEKNAHRVVEVLGELKGASLKIGQLLSADPELLPGNFSDGLASLQRDVPPMTYNTVKQQIEEAFGRPIESVFEYFDPDTIGSASIGQVHRARLESGEDVAVKIQYPGVLESLESDLKTLKQLLVYGRIAVDKERLEEYFDEVHRIVLEEADYVSEAENMGRLHPLLEEREGITSPRPFPEWTRPTVLVMEYMEGDKLDDVLAAMDDGTRRREILERWVTNYAWMFHQANLLHADPHPGNFLLDDQGQLVMLDFGCVKDVDPDFADGILDVLVGYWTGDTQQALESYLRIGYGTEGTESVDLDLLDAYHDIILAPFARNEVFDFSDWKPAKEGRDFMVRHPSFWKMPPPSEGLAFFRVLSGIKGLLYKLDARINVYESALEIAVERGRYSP